VPSSVKVLSASRMTVEIASLLMRLGSRCPSHWIHLNAGCAMDESNQFVNVEVLLRLSEVERQTGIKRSLICKRIGAASFPPPLKLGQRVSVWPQSVITRWVKSVVEGET